MADQLPEPNIRVVYDDGKVKIHTFIAPEAFLANATHIIESNNALVLIDGQFIVPYAKQFRAHVDNLGKPIKRLYLSHAHVDHFFGIGAAFDDVDVYALPQTIAYLEKSGEEDRRARAAVYGAFVAEKIVIPQHKVSAGKETIDGVDYKFIVHADTEIDYHLSIELPDLGVFIAQDLLYSGLHLYITKDIDNWVKALEEVDTSKNKLFLPGHGEPADEEEVLANIEYLKTAQQAFEKKLSSEAFKDTLLKAFPKRKGAAIFDIYLPRLFAQ